MTGISSGGATVATRLLGVLGILGGLVLLAASWSRSRPAGTRRGWSCGRRVQSPWHWPRTADTPAISRSLALARYALVYT